MAEHRIARVIPDQIVSDFGGEFRTDEVFVQFLESFARPRFDGVDCESDSLLFTSSCSIATGYYDTNFAANGP